LRDGLIALALLDLRASADAVLRALDRLQLAALELRIDPQAMFEECARFAQPEMADLILSFGQRDPGGRLF
jgi:hypothetical protein